MNKEEKDRRVLDPSYNVANVGGAGLGASTNAIQATPWDNIMSNTIGPGSAVNHANTKKPSSFQITSVVVESQRNDDSMDEAEDNENETPSFSEDSYASTSIAPGAVAPSSHAVHFSPGVATHSINSAHQMPASKPNERIRVVKIGQADMESEKSWDLALDERRSIRSKSTSNNTSPKSKSIARIETKLNNAVSNPVLWRTNAANTPAVIGFVDLNGYALAVGPAAHVVVGGPHNIPWHAHQPSQKLGDVELQPGMPNQQRNVNYNMQQHQDFCVPTSQQQPSTLGREEFQGVNSNIATSQSVKHVHFSPDAASNQGVYGPQTSQNVQDMQNMVNEARQKTATSNKEFIQDENPEAINYEKMDQQDGRMRNDQWQPGMSMEKNYASEAQTVAPPVAVDEAIDNKIEMAMDLVKSHLMVAVKEEVEVLKTKIATLNTRITYLETENAVLRAHVPPEILAKLDELVPKPPP